MSKIIMVHQGAELYGSDRIFLLAVEILSEKNDVTVILDGDGPLREKIESRVGERVEIFPLGVLRRNKLAGVGGVLRFSVEFLSAVLRMRRVIKKISPDTVYVNTLPVMSPLFAAIGSGASLVHHLHEIQDSPKLLFRGLYSLSGLLAARVIVVSKAVQECFLDNSAFGGSKVRKVYNGLPDLIIASSKKRELLSELYADHGLAEGDFLISYVARIHTWKGQLEFLDVVKTLATESDRKFKVVFCGDVYPGYESLRDLISERVRQLEIESMVSFLGYREDADVLFSISDLSVMGSTSPDPLPTVVLESMRQGTPVAAYACGGAGEMLNDGLSGFLVKPRDQSEMSAKIKFALDNPSILPGMRVEARRRFVANFSLEYFRYSFLQALDLDRPLHMKK